MNIPEAIETAIASSGNECVIIVSERHELNLRFATNALTTNGQMRIRQADVTSFNHTDKGVCPGTVSGPVETVEDLVTLVSTAEEAAKTATPDTNALPLPEGGRGVDFDQPAVEIELSAFAKIAEDLGTAFTEAEAEGHLLFGFAELHQNTRWLATTTGVRHRVVEPMGRLEFNAKDPDFVNTAWVGQQTNDFTDVDVAAHHNELRRRLAWGKNRVELPAGQYETILSPGAVVDFMVYAALTMSGRFADEGRNAFAGNEVGTNRIGDRYSDLPITIYSDPHQPEFPTTDVVIVPQNFPGMSSVFDNGAPIAKTEWFKDGVLTSLVRTRADHQEQGIDGPVAYFTENLVIDGQGTASLDEMISNTERGLLVTCLWYIREVDPQTLLLTGLTRDGVYLIENGEVTGLVNNFRFNESPLSLLRRASEVSKSEKTLCREWNDYFTRSVAPAMRIPDFEMSTVSKAY